MSTGLEDMGMTLDEFSKKVLYQDPMIDRVTGFREANDNRKKIAEKKVNGLTKRIAKIDEQIAELEAKKNELSDERDEHHVEIAYRDERDETMSQMLGDYLDARVQAVTTEEDSEECKIARKIVFDFMTNINKYYYNR